MQMHIITGTTSNRMAGGWYSISTQLHILTRQETKTIGAGCSQVEKGDIVINDFDIFHFGGDLLLWNPASITGFIRLQNDISHRSITAHQHLAAGHFLCINPKIMVSYFLDFPGNDFRNALTTISVAATITQSQARAKASLKKT
jgi:hypothetical protein